MRTPSNSFCRQEDVWGANYYPGRGPEECIELRRELLRWRDLIAEMYILPGLPEPELHASAFRSLLQLTPESARQIPYVLPAA